MAAEIGVPARFTEDTHLQPTFSVLGFKKEKKKQIKGLYKI
jgi:hypothetical protein